MQNSTRTLDKGRTHVHSAGRPKAIATAVTAFTLAIAGLVGGQPAQALTPPSPGYGFISETLYVANPPMDGSYEANIILNGFASAKSGGVLPYIVQITNSSALTFTPRVVEESLRLPFPTTNRVVNAIAPGQTTEVSVYPGGVGSLTNTNVILHIDIPPQSAVTVAVWRRQ